MASPLPPFDPAVFARAAFARAHVGWLGLRHRDAGRDWAEIELPWRADLVADADSAVLATGPIVSLMDMVGAMAVWVHDGTFRLFATLDLRVDYLRAARAHAALIGRATCYRTTRTAAFVTGVAHDGDPDDPVAHVTAVYVYPRERAAG